MNVVVSAIVDPWVTTLSFVVALAMRIQGQKLQILCRNQAHLVQAIQVGYFSRRDELLATSSVLLATRHTHLARPSARLMPRAEANKITFLPAIFK